MGPKKNSRKKFTQHPASQQERNWLHALHSCHTFADGGQSAHTRAKLPKRRSKVAAAKTPMRSYFLPHSQINRITQTTKPTSLQQASPPQPTTQARLDLPNTLHAEDTSACPHPPTHPGNPLATKFHGDLRRRVIHGQRRVRKESFSFRGTLNPCPSKLACAEPNFQPSFHVADALERVHGQACQKVTTTPQAL